MERGKPTEKFRIRSALDGSRVNRLDPYFKLQAWERGRNFGRCVPAAEVPALREDLANFERFNELAGALAEEIITRSMRRPEVASPDAPPPPLFARAGRPSPQPRIGARPVPSGSGGANTG